MDRTRRHLEKPVGDDPQTESWTAERLANILHQIREGFQIIGFDWRYLYVNEAVCRHGRRRKEDLLGRTMIEVYPGIEKTPMFALLERAMRERTSADMENEFVFPDGTKRWFELRVEPVPEGILVLSLDISQRKSLEAQLLHSQKMEAVGRLAGGIAHDFNNILTAIGNFGQFVLESLESGDQAYEDMKEVLSASQRAEALVRQLLAFSRKQVIEPRVLDVNELVVNLDVMLRRILGENIELESKRADGLWTVRIDPGAFEQVLVNLAVNARDAMPNGGKLTIETGNAILDQSYRMAKGGIVTPGDYVVLAVSDNGCGMDPQTQSQLFEPFFTTKARGKGTGLGLSTCYGIVKQAGGYIWVYSEPGRGTTFKIYLPRVDSEPARSAVGEGKKPLPLEGTETILVVEDDPQVRRLAVRALAHYGYRLLEASSGGDALLICETEKEPIHLLLTDVVMPRVSGKDVAERLQKLRPTMQILFMSGYTENAIVHHGVLDADVNLIQKPFTPERLARKIRAILDG